MLITLKTLLHTLLLPPGGPLLLAAAGAWLLRPRASAGAAKAGWLLLAAGLASLWLLATPLVVEVVLVVDVVLVVLVVLVLLVVLVVLPPCREARGLNVTAIL